MKNRKAQVLLVAAYHYGNMAIRLLQAILKEKKYHCDLLFFQSAHIKQIKTTLYNFPKEVQEEFVLPSAQDYERFEAFIQKTRPDIIGFNVMSFYFSVVAALSKISRRVSPAPIVWGGVHSTIAPEECLCYADFLCLGEGCESFPEFLDALSHNRAPKGIKGFGYRENGRMVIHKRRNSIKNLDRLPFVDFSPGNKYYLDHNAEITTQADAWLFPGSADAPYKTYHTIMTSFGCPFQCTYCINSVERRNSVRRSADNVIAELQKVKKDNPHLRIVIFYDDIFTINEKWCREFAQKYKKAIDLPFMCHIHPHVSREILIVLRKAGLISVAMGIESGSDRMRRIMARPEKNKTILTTARHLEKLREINYKDLGNTFQIFYDIITHNPLDTEKDLKSTFKLLCRLPRNFVLNQYALSYFPNYPLTKKILDEGLITPEDIEGMGKIQPKALTHFLAALSMKEKDKKKNIHNYYFIAFSITQYRIFPKWLMRQITETDFWKKRIFSLYRIARFLRIISIFTDIRKYRKSLKLFKPIPGRP